MDDRSYVKNPLRSSTILNVENGEKYCFLWSILASLLPCNNNHPNRVSTQRQYFNELNKGGFDFNNGFNCSDVHKIEKRNNSSINIIELNIYQDQNKCRHKLIPIEVSKSDSDRIFDLIIYKFHWALIKKLKVILEIITKLLSVEDVLIHIQVKIC